MAEGRFVSEWKRLRPYFDLLDFSSKPQTRVAWFVRLAVVAFATFALYRRINTTIDPLLSAKVPVPIPTEEIEDYRFRLPERTRKEIFEQIAAAEISERQRAIEKNTWEGQLWSREDDRGHYERVELRELAKRYKISLTQAYLILDEGIREHWLGPDGKPLPATSPPLNPRTTW